MEYFALLIPIALIVILFLVFRQKTAIWEYFVPTISTIIVVLCMHGCMQSSRTTDTEYMTQKITNGCHEDPWDEEVPCRHEIPCSHPKYCKDNDKDGEYQCGYQHSNDGYYHAYDVDFHDHWWYVVGEYGTIISVSETYYNNLVKEWNNVSFVDMHRDYHSIDGDKHVTKWLKDFATTKTITWEHEYENKVQASTNIIAFDDVDTTDIKQYSLFEYPAISTFNQQFILSDRFYVNPADKELLKKVNGHLGPAKQCQIFILLFKNKDYHAAELQHQYWKGANKNEFVICIGVDDLGKIQWNYNFTWSESTICGIEIKDYILAQKKLDVSKTLNYSFTELNKNFARKQFADFDYLKIDLTHGQVNSIYITIVILNILIGLWIILNEFDSETTETEVSFFKTVTINKPEKISLDRKIKNFLRERFNT